MPERALEHAQPEAELTPELIAQRNAEVTAAVQAAKLAAAKLAAAKLEAELSERANPPAGQASAAVNARAMASRCGPQCLTAACAACNVLHQSIQSEIAQRNWSVERAVVQ